MLYVVTAWFAAVCAANAQAPSASVPGGPTAGTIWLIFVDDLHLHFQDTGRLRGCLSEIARELFRDGDLFAVRSSGASALAVDLTSDRALLHAAIAKVSGAALAPRDILEARSRPGGSDETVYRASVALSGARQMLVTVRDAHSRRKAAIYVSGGYGFELSSRGGPPSGATSGGTPVITVDDLRREFAALVLEARRTGVRIFTTEPPGLKPRARLADAAEWEIYLALTQRTRRALSEQTGGVALPDARDSSEIVKRIRDAVR